jgi:hypothetical protein
MDAQLPSNARLSPELEAKVRDSAVMIIVLSTGYLASEWAQKEMSQFLEEEVRRRGGTSSRIFIVELSNVERPPALRRQEVVGTRFWVKDQLTKRVRTLGFSEAERKDPCYIHPIMELSEDIAAELERQKAAPAVVQEIPASGAPHRPTIYLAEVTDDLEDQRDDVRRYLVQAGFQVLPANRYPEDLEGFEKAVRADLDRSILFVQLLSEVAGRKVAGSERRRVAFQYDLCKERPTALLLWRSRSLDPAKVSNPGHRALLDNPEVMAVNIEEFKETIVRRVRACLMPKLPNKKEQIGRDYLVFVNAAEDDLPLAECVSRELDKRSIGFVLPLRQGQPSAIREDMEQNLRECDAMILIFGRTDALWVRTQLRQARKIIAQRDHLLQIIAVYEGPPPKPRNVLGIKLANLPLCIMKCLSGPNEVEFNTFVDALRQRSLA